MVTALFAKTMEELQNHNEVTPRSQAYTHTHTHRASKLINNHYSAFKNFANQIPFDSLG
jgi:hypothetical protein